MSVKKKIKIAKEIFKETLPFFSEDVKKKIKNDTLIAYEKAKH
jgi:hypothetical protein